MEGGEFITIHKVAHPVVVYVGPFVVTGRLHTIQEATLAQALDAMLEDFVAITQPSLLCMTNRALSLKEGVIAAVRKGKIVALHERLSSA